MGYRMVYFLFLFFGTLQQQNKQDYELRNDN